MLHAHLIGLQQLASLLLFIFLVEQVLTLENLGRSSAWLQLLVAQLHGELALRARLLVVGSLVGAVGNFEVLCGHALANHSVLHILGR